MTQELYIYDETNLAWVDMGVAYGISLHAGALDALLMPPPLKAFPTNRSRLEDGVRYTVVNPRFDERQVTIPFHIVAASEADLFVKHAALCNILKQGRIIIKTAFQPDVVYKLVVQGLSQFTHIGRIALFQLKCVEPDPTDRTL